MWLFTCAGPRNPTKPPSGFKVHRPPSDEWVYGAWTGSSHRQELARREFAGRQRAERERRGAEPEPSRKPEASRKRLQNYEQRGNADKMRTEGHHQPKRGREHDSGAHWATLAEIEANERFGPRGRNERYEGGAAESVDGRYEPAYAKLIAQSARNGRSHTQQGEEFQDRRNQRCPWKADVGMAVPKLSKFREDFSR